MFKLLAVVVTIATIGAYAAYVAIPHVQSAITRHAAQVQV